MSGTSLAGLNVLVVEDEMLVSMLIEEFLSDQACRIIGPMSRIGPALRAAQTEAIDFALLDVNLAGDPVYPVAEALAGRNIPFLFLSGYGHHALPANRPAWRVCSKPFRAHDLAAMMIDQMAERQTT